MSQNRNAVARLEDFIQGSVEGFFSRVFRTGVNKIEIARKLERAMDEGVVVNNNQRRAPNAYKLFMSEADFRAIRQYARLLKSQLQDGLLQMAKQRGYLLTTNPLVAIEVDARLGKGNLRTETSFLDAAQMQQQLAAAQGSANPTSPNLGDAPPDFTQVIAPQPAPPAAGAGGLNVQVGGPLPDAALVLRTPQGPGQTYPLNREVIHIGRHKSNDIVIKEERVSRYHAEIRFERGQFVLYDLGSLNGVVVNGMLTRHAILRPGDIIGIGSYSFVFERR
jgi:hypothetical protein